MDARLQRAMEEFAKTRDSVSGFQAYRGCGLDTVEGAYGMRDTTSHAFIAFAKAAGVEVPLNAYEFDVASGANPDTTLYRTGQHPTAEYRRAGWHCIVEAPDFFIDFTARQYHQDACYPHIISKNLIGQSAKGAAAGGE